MRELETEGEKEGKRERIKDINMEYIFRVLEPTPKISKHHFLQHSEDSPGPPQ
jgi:hypothetical protein